MFEKLSRMMNNRVIKNFGRLFISMIISTVGTFFCYAILGNKMTVDDYGLFGSVIALTSMIAVFANNVLAGIVVNREISITTQRSYQLFRFFLFVRVICYIASGIILYFYIQIKQPTYFMIFVPLLCILFFEVFWDLFEQVAFGLKITTISMVLNILFTVSWLIAVFLMPQKEASLKNTLVVYSVLCVLKTVAYGVCVFNKTKEYKEYEFRPNKKELFAYSGPYLYNRILGTVSTQLPVLLLDGYAGLEQTAYYSIGEKFTAPLTKLTTVAISAFFPFITKKMKEDRKGVSQLVSSCIQIVVSTGACISIILCATSDYWFVALLGEKYTNAVEAFNYQLWYAVVISVDCIISMVLSCDYKQKTLSVITTIDAIMFLFAMYFGIRGGAKGISIAKLCVAAICLLYHLIIISRYYGGKNALLRLVFSWIIFFVMLMCSLLLTNKFMLCVSAVICIVLCVVLNRGTISLIVLGLKAKFGTEK